MKYIFTILLISISVNIFAQKSLELIKDNWFDIKGNWVLTVTDNSIIYKNAFWDYKIESETRKQILLQTINGEVSQRMSFSLIDNSNMKFALGSKEESLSLSKDRQVEFPTQNNKIKYQPDTVTINGYVKSFPRLL